MISISDFPEDPTRPTIEHHIGQGTEIEVPWQKKEIALGTGLLLSAKDKTRSTMLNAFENASDPPAMIFRRETVVNYRRSASSHAEANSEHLTVGVKASVEVAGGLLSASAQVDYNKQVESNSDAEKYSTHASYRYGSITLRDPPTLSYSTFYAVPARADRLANIDDFTSKYGDYYVGALVLGVDNSVMISSSVGNSTSKEGLDVKVEVNLVGIRGTVESHKNRFDSKHTAGMSMVGFDSLDGKVVTTPPGTPLDSQALTRLVEYASTIESRVQRAFGDITLTDGGLVSDETCAALCRSGLVVSIVLMPFVKNESYVTAWNRRSGY